MNIHVDLKENSMEDTYKVKQNSFLMDQYPNMVTILFHPHNVNVN